MISVAIYSDQPILAAGLKALVVAEPLFELAACCSNLADYKEHLADLNPDLAVIDLTPQITSDALHDFQRLAPASKLILWTNSIAADFAMEALTIGVRGVLRKTLTLEAHRQCLRRVSAGEIWFEKCLTDRFRSSKRIFLTARESQLIMLLSRGLKNKEISAELGITEGTVKVYLSHLFQKAGAKDRLDLALQGIKNFSMAGMPGQGALRSLTVDPF